MDHSKCPFNQLIVTTIPLEITNIGKWVAQNVVFNQLILITIPKEIANIGKWATQNVLGKVYCNFTFLTAFTHKNYWLSKVKRHMPFFSMPPKI